MKSPDLCTFLRCVKRSAAREAALDSPECARAVARERLAEFMVATLLELYDERSSPERNLQRICLSLRSAAYELEAFEQRLVESVASAEKSGAG